MTIGKEPKSTKLRLHGFWVRFCLKRLCAKHRQKVCNLNPHLTFFKFDKNLCFEINICEDCRNVSN